MTVQTMLPRGIRNNNPLNIRLNPENRWQGRVSPKLNSDSAFEQFQDPVMGLRAAAVLLITHYDRRHLDTIRKLVEVWAPPNENDTEAYARCVAEESGFGIDEPLDLHDYACLRPILTAMIRVKNGRQPYTDAQIDAALVRAGVIAAAALAARDADGQRRAGRSGRHNRCRGDRRDPGDSRPSARRARRRGAVPRCGEMGTPHRHADRHRRHAMGPHR
jgi:hypothetical protein